VKQVEDLKAEAAIVPDLAVQVAEVRWNGLFGSFFFFNLQLPQLTARNGHLLQMYGAKAEEATELKMDLSDVKALFQAQLQQLVIELEAVRGLNS
jgi:hypothetical protein